MGARSGGSGVLKSGDATGENIEVTNVESLKNIKDRQLYNEMKSAISRFYKEMGIPQKDVKLANFSDPKVAGLNEVDVNGNSVGVYLNKKYFKNGTKKSVTDLINSNYKSGFLTKTNKPVAHVLTHELAHSIWNEDMNSPKHKAAGKAILKVYNKWMADRKKTGYGKYAKQDASEFFSEAITKAIHGKADKYTKALKKIVKDYKL